MESVRCASYKPYLCDSGTMHWAEYSKHRLRQLTSQAHGRLVHGDGDGAAEMRPVLALVIWQQSCSDPPTSTLEHTHTHAHIHTRTHTHSRTHAHTSSPHHDHSHHTIHTPSPHRPHTVTTPSPYRPQTVPAPPLVFPPNACAERDAGTCSGSGLMAAG